MTRMELEAETPVLARRGEAIAVVIGLYEIASALAGMLMAAWFATHSLGARVRGSALLTLMPFAALLAAGCLLLVQQRGGRTLSIALQASQVVSVSTASLVWRFCAGVYAYIELATTNVHAFVGLDFSFLYGRASVDAPVVLSVNLVPLGLVAVLLGVPWLRDGTRNEPDEDFADRGAT